MKEMTIKSLHVFHNHSNEHLVAQSTRIEIIMYTIFIYFEEKLVPLQIKEPRDARCIVTLEAAHIPSILDTAAKFTAKKKVK